VKVQNEKVLACLLFAWFLCLSATVDAVAEESVGCVNLVGSDFSKWRGSTGQWKIVGDAFTNPANEKLLSSKPGTGVIINGRDGRDANLVSKSEFGDIKAHIEFMVSKDSNSGVYFMGRYEVQIFDSKGKKSPYPGIECGGIYQRWEPGRKPKPGFEGHSPRFNVSRKPGQWQSFDVVFRAPRFDKNGHKIADARFDKIVHNGTLVHADVRLTGPTRAGMYKDEKPTGPLMLQGDHGPVAYRNIRIEQADPNPFFAMDNGMIDSKHKTAKQQVQMIKELGYAGVGCNLNRVNLNEMLPELDKNGLRLFSLYIGVNIDPDKQGYRKGLKEAIDALNGRKTILWLLVLSGEHKPSALSGDPHAVQVIREIADMASAAELRVALYPHANCWIERVEDAVRVVKKVSRKNVGATFNLCHWLKVENAEGRKNMKSLIKSAMPYLFLVTINGADKDGRGWKQLIQTLDRGSFDVSGFLGVLRESGYTGPIGLQSFGIGGDAHENLKRSMGAWRQFSGRKTTKQK